MQGVLNGTPYFLGVRMAILWVNGAEVPTPSSFSWGKQDISSPEAGRDQTGRMFKEKVGDMPLVLHGGTGIPEDQVKPEKAHRVLSLFSDEYFNVRYFDPLAGDYTEKEFYCGDMSAPMYMFTDNNKLFANVAFNVIER